MNPSNAIPQNSGKRATTPSSQSQYVYLDGEALAVRTAVFEDEVMARCRGCNYILTRDHVTACRCCLADSNARYKSLRTSLHQCKAETLALKEETDFLRTWDTCFINGDSASGDVTLKTRDGHCFTTYRFLLASKSPVFNHILDEKKSVMELEVEVDEDISSAVLAHFLDYLYRAQLGPEVLEEHAAALLQVAHTYQVPTLKGVCERHLVKHIHPDNVVAVLELAFKSDAEALKEAAFNVAASMHNMFVSCPEMKSLVEREPRIAAAILTQILAHRSTNWDVVA